MVSRPQFSGFVHFEPLPAMHEPTHASPRCCRSTHVPPPSSDQGCCCAIWKIIRLLSQIYQVCGQKTSNPLPRADWNFCKWASHTQRRSTWGMCTTCTKQLSFLMHICVSLSARYISSSVPLPCQHLWLGPKLVFKWVIGFKTSPNRFPFDPTQLVLSQFGPPGFTTRTSPIHLVN